MRCIMEMRHGIIVYPVPMVILLKLNFSAITRAATRSSVRLLIMCSLVPCGSPVAELTCRQAEYA